MTIMKFLIADDHPMTRRGVRRLIEEVYADAEVTEVIDGESALEAIRATPFDLVVLDLSMPHVGGLEALARIQRMRPEQRVLVLSMHAEREFAVRCINEGAAGYITKERGPDELLGAITRIMSGRRYVSPEVAEALVDGSLGGAVASPHERLSSREFAVLRLLARGLTVSEAGDRLALSPKTVSTYRARILEKLGVSNNIELSRYCTRHGLID